MTGLAPELRRPASPDDKHQAMDVFRRLGAHVERRWRALHHDEEVFPQLAEEALGEFCPARELGALDPLEWLLTTDRVPTQMIDQGNQFGQPPIQVYSTRGFYIEVLYWLDGTTAIHEHGFNGAFHVMSGSSVHCLYRFDQQRRLNSGIKLGQVTRTHSELLRKGDTRQILAGSAMAHSLFHLERPSVTVVVRTHHVPGADPQYSYLQPGIAYDSFRDSDLLSRRLQALYTLADVGDPRLEELMAAAFTQTDPHLVVALVLGLRRRPTLRGVIVNALERVRGQFGDLIQALLLAEEELARQDAIVDLRRKLTTADHRFLLAMLMHFHRGADILELIARRHPGQDARALVLGWLEACTQAPDPDDPTRRVLNLSFDGSMLEVMKPLLGGGTLEDTLAALRAEFGDDQVRDQADDIGRLYRGLAGHAVLGPLFR